MKTISLLQLGDIHYPDHKATRIGDIKDTGMPTSLVDAISPNRLHAAIQRVDKVIRDLPISGLLICGDLTTRGDLSEYDLCVEYLSNALSIASATPLAHSSVHVVPGNHDVNRNLCDPDEKELLSKFDPLVASWDRHAKGILAVKSLRSTDVSTANGSLKLFSLNSCIGCGERRHIPAKIRQRLSSIVAQYTAAASPDDANELIYEQLDTPAFFDADLDDLVNIIRTLPPTALPIVLAHHNVLPQAIPRIEVYTELINSGSVRNRLASCRRPVIYCHGHIHSDPIERLIDCKYGDSSVLFVSAPEATDGFNVLTFHFGRTNQLPLGCEITKHRKVHGHGPIEESETLRVPFVTRELIGQFDDEVMTALLSSCSSTHMRFKALRETMGETVGRNLHTSTIQDVVIEAEWLGLVSIDDRNLPAENWKVRKVEP